MQANERSKRPLYLTALMLTCGLTMLAAPAAAWQSSTTSDAPKADEPKTDAALPSAEDVLQRSIKARGGEAALRKYTARTTVGAIEVPGMGLSGSLRTYAAEPNLFLLEIDIPGVGETRSGYNGDVGWSINQMQGPMLLEGAMLEDLRREADFYVDLNYRSHFPTIEVVQKTEFENQPCYELRMVDKADKETTTFFHAESGFLVGIRATSETPMGPMTSVTTMSDYQAFDEVFLPRVMTVHVMGVEQKMTVESVSHAPIDRKVFDLPAEILALLAATQTSDPGTKDEKNGVDGDGGDGDDGGDGGDDGRNGARRTGF